MTSLLVRKTTCPYCNNPVELSYSKQEFNEKFTRLYNAQPSFQSYPITFLTEQLFETIVCNNCSEKLEAEEPTREELNRDYWQNYSISNPNE